MIALVCDQLPEELSQFRKLRARLLVSITFPHPTTSPARRTPFPFIDLLLATTTLERCWSGALARCTLGATNRFREAGVHLLETL